MIVVRFKSLFWGFFSCWYVVGLLIFLLVFLPGFLAPLDLVPFADQLVGQSLLVTVVLAVAALGALVVATAAMLVVSLSDAKKGENQLVGFIETIGLSVFLCLLVAFLLFHVRGGDESSVGFLDFLFIGRLPFLAATVLIALALSIPAIRRSRPLEDAMLRMRQLAAAFVLATLPLILIFLLQSARLLWPADRLVPATRPTRGYSNVIVVLMDALPMDGTSLLTGEGERTPSLDRFARKSFLFTRAYSPANVTAPSVMTLLTGKHPVNHRVSQLKMSLRGSARRENLPVELRKAGFSTGATVFNIEAYPPHLKMEGFDRVYPLRGRGWLAKLQSAVSRLSGFNLGNIWSFSLENWLWEHIPDPGQSRPWPPEMNFQDALEFLSEGGGPRFVYIHVMAPHLPYLAEPGDMYSFLPIRGFMDRRDNCRVAYRPYPESYRNTIGMIELRFEESLYSVDRQLGDFLDRLEAAGRFEDSIIVVLSDHGEMFDTRWVGHDGPYLDDPLVHVPLVIHMPGQKEGRTIDAPIGHVDIAPTLLDLEGIPAPPWMDGASWKPVLADGYPPPDRSIYSFTSDAILSLSAGKANQGSCRVTRSNSRAVLDLRKRSVEWTDGKGSRTIALPGQGVPDRAASPGIDCIANAVQYFSPKRAAEH